MPETLSPGVFIQELPGARPIEAVATSTAAFVGETAKGKVGKPVFVTSFEEFVLKFGGFISGANTAYLVNHFFNEGGTRAYVARIAGEGSPAAVEATATFDDVSAGTAFGIKAQSVGTWGNGIAVRITTASNMDDPGLAGSAFNLEVLTLNASGNLLDVVEVFEDLTVDSADGSNYIGNALAEGQSDYIELDDAVTPSGERPDNSSGGTGTQLTGGTDPDPADWGSVDTHLTVLDVLEDINIVVTPEVDVASQHALAAGYCENRGDCFYVGGTDVTDFSTVRSNYGFNTHSALYTPFIRVSDPLTGSQIELPASGAVAGIMARTDNNRGVWKAPAGRLDGRVRSALGLSEEISMGDQDLLNPIGVNAIRNMAGSGITVWGARTLSSDPQWRYVNVRRLVTFIETSIKRGIAFAVFEPNNEALRSSVRREISNFLRTVWTDGGLFGETEAEAFFVKVDETNNPPSSVDLGRLIVDVGVAPVRPAEFVIIRISQSTQQP